MSRYVGEFLATFAPVLAGTGAIIANDVPPFVGATLAILSCRWLRSEGCCLECGGEI